MPAPLSPPDPSYLDRIRWVEVENAAASASPGGGLLRVTGAATDGTPTVSQPDANGQAGLLVAHPTGIAAGGRGLATTSAFALANYDPADGTPAVGETWGSETAGWRLRKGKAGWRIGAPPTLSQDLTLVEAWRVECERQKLFRISSGVNPYAGTEVSLSEADGSRATTAGGVVLTAADKRLWEINGGAKVPANTVVVAHRNPTGTGWYFSHPVYFDRAAIDICVEKSGANVTDVRVTYENADDTTDCELASTCGGSTCDALWWCTTTGVVSAAGGTEPAGSIGGPHLTYAAAAAYCATSPSGEPAGGTMTSGCCVAQKLNSTMPLVLSGGNGTVNLVWNGTVWVSASVTLPCGVTAIFNFTTSCTLTWSTDGGGTFAGSPGGVKTCGPPFSWAVTSIALGGACGTLTGTLTG